VTSSYACLKAILSDWRKSKKFVEQRAELYRLWYRFNATPSAAAANWETRQLPGWPRGQRWQLLPDQ
jgi:hypothetical protein